MPLTNYAENAHLDSLTSANVVIGASTTTPTKTGTNVTEPSGNGYARITSTPSDWEAASGGSIQTANNLEHPEATGSWGTITHVVFWDAAESNIIGWAALAESKSIVSGQTLRYLAGEIDWVYDQA